MKRYVLFLLTSLLLFTGFYGTVFAQEEIVEVEAAPVVTVATEDVGIPSGENWHTAIKARFIEGNAFFMSFIAIVFIIGLAFCFERIIYLNLSEIDTNKFVRSISDAVEADNIEKALAICEETRGPVASIYYEGLSRIDEGIEVVEKSVIAAGGVQTGWLEKGLSWISLFIAIAPSLGFLGTVIGMIQAFEDIQSAEEMNAAIVAGGMKIALITTVGGLIVGLILQIFYNYILSKIENILNKMEDATLSLLDIVVRYQVNKKGKK
ncbi:MAG: MotA/TolQ/ExbB proton channel family protein [Candidatus Azobacteroides sp.]|nr:MotA/TolQ/ExbB proton channel family protein [Candidatus Azobacteroides sp.]